jgi:hypothetical protein
MVEFLKSGVTNSYPAIITPYNGELANLAENMPLTPAVLVSLDSVTVDTEESGVEMDFICFDTNYASTDNFAKSILDLLDWVIGRLCDYTEVPGNFLQWWPDDSIKAGRLFDDKIEDNLVSAGIVSIKIKVNA